MKPENGSKHQSGPVMATSNIRSLNERSRKPAVYIFILSNQPIIQKTNEILVSSVKLYQGDKVPN